MAQFANILFFMCDSMDGRAMGCMDHPAASTPNLDRLASRGTIFRRAYCNSPQCCPSRSSMWSGQYVHRVEAWNNIKGLTAQQPTVRDVLADSGYETRVFGKQHYRSSAQPAPRGITAWIRAAGIEQPQDKYAPAAELLETDTKHTNMRDWTDVDAAIAWLQENGRDRTRPFFLTVSVRAPHPQFRTSSYWLSQIYPQLIDIPPIDTNMHPVMRYMSVTKNAYHDYSDDQVRAIRQYYLAMVAEVDAMLASVLATLDEVGVSDQTHVVFASDHGEMGMEHRQHLKNAMYEPSTRVPLIVAGPGLRRGAVNDGLVSLIDLAPTFLDFAGLQHSHELDGHSLVPACRGEQTERPGWVFSEYHSNFANTGIFMLRKGDWKYIAYPGYESQLFNVDADPWEHDNQIRSNASVAVEMADLLRSICDINSVDARAKAYDRACFRQWRNSVDIDEYQEVMTRRHRGDWGVQQDALIEAWLRAA